MPFLQRPCGARIYYEVKGKGSTPLLLLAPGGMRSSIPKWDNTSKYTPWETLPTDKFMLIGMDQRFANRSTGFVRPTDSWDTFLQDQVALLDHLKIRKCHIVGSCIGPSYAFNLMVHHPHRFGKCVMLQPIGLAPHTTEPDVQWEGLNETATWSWVGDWARERLKNEEIRKEETMDLLEKLHTRMFGGKFVFSITSDQATRVTHPLLVFMGRDQSHPAETSRQICRLCPNAELVPIWRNAGPEAMANAMTKIDEFLFADP